MPSAHSGFPRVVGAKRRVVGTEKRGTLDGLTILYNQRRSTAILDPAQENADRAQVPAPQDISLEEINDAQLEVYGHGLTGSFPVKKGPCGSWGQLQNTGSTCIHGITEDEIMARLLRRRINTS